MNDRERLQTLGEAANKQTSPKRVVADARDADREMSDSLIGQDRQQIVATADLDSFKMGALPAWLSIENSASPLSTVAWPVIGADCRTLGTCLGSTTAGTQWRTVPPSTDA